MAIRAACVRMGSIRLSLAMILALLLVPGYVVAPALFAKLDAHTAGMVAGSIFHISNLAILMLAVTVAAFWLRTASVGRLNWSFLLIVVALVCANEFAISPVMQEMKDAVGNMSALPKDHPQRVQFGMLHGISAVVHLLASGFAALLVAWGGARQDS